MTKITLRRKRFGPLLRICERTHGFYADKNYSGTELRSGNEVILLDGEDIFVIGMIAFRTKRDKKQSMNPIPFVVGILFHILHMGTVKFRCFLPTVTAISSGFILLPIPVRNQRVITFR